MERLNVYRDLLARAQLRIEELERENRALLNKLEQAGREPQQAPRRFKYQTEAERLAARRKTWRDSQRRRTQRLKEAA